MPSRDRRHARKGSRNPKALKKRKVRRRRQLSLSKKSFKAKPVTSERDAIRRADVTSACHSIMDIARHGRPRRRGEAYVAKRGIGREKAENICGLSPGTPGSLELLQRVRERVD